MKRGCVGFESVTGSLTHEPLIDEHRARFGVEPISRTLAVSASAYYQRATGARSDRAREDERLARRVREVHQDNYEAYGYRDVWRAVTRAGETAGRDRWLPDARGGHPRRRGKPWRNTKPAAPAHGRPHLVNRDFQAERPHQLWVADISYLRRWKGVLFFAFIMDAFSRMIAGWRLAAQMRTTLVLDAFKMALGLRDPGADLQLVHHSDRGSQPALNRSSQQCVSG